MLVYHFDIIYFIFHTTMLNHHDRKKCDRLMALRILCTVNRFIGSMLKIWFR
jgi:hypothetical protein